MRVPMRKTLYGRVCPTVGIKPVFSPKGVWANTIEPLTEYLDIGLPEKSGVMILLKLLQLMRKSARCKMLTSSNAGIPKGNGIA